MNKNLLLLPASALLLIACGGNGPSAEFDGDPVTDPNEVVNALNSALSNIDLAKGLSISLETDGQSVAKETDATASMQIESTTTVEYDVKLDAKVAGLKQKEAFQTGDIYVEAGLTGSASLSVDMSSAGESLMNTAFDIPSLDEQLHIKDNVLYVDISEGAADAIRNRGSSLLPAGVRGVVGRFAKGSLVEIADAESGDIVARGLAEENSDKIKESLASADKKKCGHKDVVVHRDNLAVV